MKIRKQAIFIGGIHGVGKTTLCNKLSLLFNCTIVKQRTLIFELSENINKKWSQIASNHTKFIPSASKLALHKFNYNNSSILLIDCHYSIRRVKAMRNYNPQILDKFIPDLEKNFVNNIIKFLPIRFVQLISNLSTCIERFHDRPKHLLDFDNTIEGLKEAKFYENLFFHQMITNFKITKSNYIIIENDISFDYTLKKIIDFINI